MPYIHQDIRKQLLPPPTQWGNVPKDVGELNFVLTTTINQFLDTRIRDYAAYNSILGVLTAMQHEIYRRLIAPYEDQKIQENGDVF